MKVVAQSSIPSTLPYMHLAYTAAAYEGLKLGLIAGGLFLLFAGLATLGSAFGGKWGPPRTLFNLLRRMFRPLIIVGGLLALIGLSSLLVGALWYFE